jgi:hypothetical protein
MYDLKLLVFLVYTAIKISVVKATRNKSGCTYNLYTRCSGEMNSKGLSMLGISSMMHYDVKFEKFISAHNENGDIVETCIMVPSAIYDVDSRMYNMVRIIAPMTIGIVVLSTGT